MSFLEHMHEVVEPPPTAVLYCYDTWQDAFKKLPGVQFYEGIPDKSALRNGMLLIIDDLMNEIDQRIVELFTNIVIIWVFW